VRRFLDEMSALEFVPGLNYNAGRNSVELFSFHE